VPQHSRLAADAGKDSQALSGTRQLTAGAGAAIHIAGTGDFPRPDLAEAPHLTHL